MKGYVVCTYWNCIIEAIIMSTHNIPLLSRWSRKKKKKKKKKKHLNCRHLLPDQASWLILSGSNYPYLEQIFMVPKMFEPKVHTELPHSRVIMWFWSRSSAAFRLCSCVDGSTSSVYLVFIPHLSFFLCLVIVAFPWYLHLYLSNARSNLQ